MHRSTVTASPSTVSRNSEPLELSSEAVALVRRALEASGCRYTQQRATVYAYLERVNCHPTAEEVYKAVRRQMPHISLGTVYKALEALVKSQLATKITNGDGSSRYDCRGEDHYHLRDVATGELRDLPAPFDPNLLTKLDSKLVDTLAKSGFRVTGYRLEVLGRFEE
jgi:Fe2+ or Zn2+ uptake regulation protein